MQWPHSTQIIFNIGFSCDFQYNYNWNIWKNTLKIHLKSCVKNFFFTCVGIFQTNRFPYIKDLPLKINLQQSEMVKCVTFVVRYFVALCLACQSFCQSACKIWHDGNWLFMVDWDQIIKVNSIRKSDKLYDPFCWNILLIIVVFFCQPYTDTYTLLSKL